MDLKKILQTLVYLFFAISFAFNFFLYQKLQKAEEVKVVEKVYDGDSLLLKSGLKVRLGNLEAPELEFCGGLQAKKRLEDLVLGKKVELEIFGTDKFKRSIALVYLGKTLVNEVLLKEGWARYDGTPNPKREILKKAYDEAFENKKGIFSPLCLSEKPDDPKCLIKGNIDRHSKQKTYHFPGCSEYEQVMVEKDRGEKWFCSEEEATKEGFVKASNCFEKSFSP